MSFRCMVMVSLVLTGLSTSSGQAQYGGYGGYGGYGYGYGYNTRYVTWGDRVQSDLQVQAQTKATAIKAFDDDKIAAAQAAMYRQQARQLAIQNATVNRQTHVQQDQQQEAQFQQLYGNLAQQAIHPSTSSGGKPAAPRPTTQAATRPTTESPGHSVAPAPMSRTQAAERLNWTEGLLDSRYAAQRSQIELLMNRYLHASAPADREGYQSQLRTAVTSLTNDIQANASTMSNADYLAARDFLRQLAMATF